MKKVLFYIVYFIPLSIHAQYRDSVAHIPEVEIIESRFESFQTGFKKTTIDSSILLLSNAQTLADLLANNSPIHIKNYGPSNIATASFRGTGAQHTAVLWNGFNIQQPMLGQFDFSLFPNFAIDAIDIQHGGNGALYGSGAIGGTIILKQLPGWNEGLKSNIAFTVGSFGRLQQMMSVSYGRKKYAGKLLVSVMESKNNFEFRRSGDSIGQKNLLPNAQLKQVFVSSDHYWKYKQRHTFSIHGWYQLATRQIAPSLNEASSKAFQEDNAIRLTADWNYHTNKGVITSRSGLFFDVLNYNDANKSIQSTSNSYNWISEIEYSRVWGRYIKSNSGINYTYSQANADGYQNVFSQQRTAIFYAIKYHKLKWTLQQSLRAELFDQTLTPIMPSIGAQFALNKNLQFMANISRSYKVPTLNERFWKPGGNPNLIPESGWGGETGGRYAFQTAKMKWEYNFTFYMRNNFNQIIWLMGNGFPQPVNMKQINTSGTEQSIKLNYPIHTKWRVSSMHGINTTEAINKNKLSANDASENKYLIYTPRVSQQHQVTLSYSKLSMVYQHAYNGMRFITTDNTKWLDHYSTGNLMMSMGIPLHHIHATFQFAIYNIWDEDYVVVAERPMPGRNFQFTITLKL